MRRRRIMGGEGALAKAVNAIKQSGESELQVITRVLNMTNTDLEAIPENGRSNIEIIHQHAIKVDPDYRGNITNTADVAVVLNTYIEDKKKNLSNPIYRLYKHALGISDFENYVKTVKQKMAEKVAAKEEEARQEEVAAKEEEARQNGVSTKIDDAAKTVTLYYNESSMWQHLNIQNPNGYISSYGQSLRENYLGYNVIEKRVA